MSHQKSISHRHKTKKLRHQHLKSKTYPQNTRQHKQEPTKQTSIKYIPAAVNAEVKGSSLVENIRDGDAAVYTDGLSDWGRKVCLGLYNNLK